MSDWLALLWVLPIGWALGIFYFGGLWLTVNRLPQTAYPSVLALVSFLIRSTLTLAGFYLVMADRWERAVVLMLGFLLARLMTVRYWGSAPQRKG